MKKLLFICVWMLSALGAVAQGVFVRGAHNSWGAAPADEMTLQSDGTYTIENYTLTGQFKIADANWSAACNYGAAAFWLASTGLPPAPRFPDAGTPSA